MTYGGFGGSLFLIAVGAILRYAITWESDTVDIDVVGLILMLAGAVTLILTVFFLLAGPRAGPPAR
ncbi:MAG TPA: DUF6458 family protein [Gaiellaceae bacterium]|nr:DUF6458 family protein [Gaiellaceae bacterium]